MQDGSDAGLLARLQAGDTTAFDELYDRYRPRIFGFLLRLSRDVAVAEELTQETFLRLVRKADTLREDTRFGVWLFVVARNLAVSQRRWAVLDQERLKWLASVIGSRSGRVETPLETAVAADLTRRVEAALGRIPVGCREVLLLVGVEGLTPAEAAEVLGLTPEAVRQRLSRGRQMLRESVGVSAGVGEERRRA